jgi:hypothetical protein
MKLPKNEGEFTPAEFLVNRKTMACKQLKPERLAGLPQQYAAQVVHCSATVNLCSRAT